MRKEADIPWARVGIEGFAIVASILLAFAIDAWWDSRNETAEEQRLLAALRSEMFDNAESAARFANRMQAKATSVRILMDALASVEAGGSVELSNEHLASAFNAGTYGPQRAVYDAMVQSGQLRLIRNSELREKLAGWPAVLDDATENDSHIREVWGPKVTERLIRDVSAMEVLEYLECESDEQQDPCANNVSAVQSDSEVIGLLTMSYVFSQEAAREMRLLADYSKAISNMIAEELDSQ